MRNILIAALMMPAAAMAGVPDSVWVRPAMHNKDQKNLYIEWSADGQRWSQSLTEPVTNSDFGEWGKQKKMYRPALTVDAEGVITLTFAPLRDGNVTAVSRTRDFIHWTPQDYYEQTSTAEATPIRLPYAVIEALKTAQLADMQTAERHGELAKDNDRRFRGLDSVRAEVRVSAQQPRAISPTLMGIFFEDINYCADGGLNADLVQNGDFEYQPSDRKGDKQWNQLTAWTQEGGITVDTTPVGISQNNAHAVAISGQGSLRNTGWDGIALRKGNKYDLSIYTTGGKAKVSLVSGTKTLASTTLSAAKDWKRQTATLTPKHDADSAVLVIEPLDGTVALDMVSLMPRDTYKGHGLRRDLAEALEALHPKFMRFPGGCVAHGDGLGNIYNWKETIGPMEDRKPARNLWGYHQSRRIGYYEFFQMCEDMGMEPLPVVAAGVPCQNSSDGGHGQMGGIPMDQMPQYIQDVLDLIEWANGDAKTTTWGKKRAEQGHPKPFNLKMIGIGNEDLISEVFTERYLMICRAVKARYPDIEICGTAGPYYTGADYETGWQVATANSDIIDMVDEHYYVSPGWYIWNQDFYDQYDRTAPKVYLGEWAAHGPGRKSTVETALSEAMHFCNLERNGDVVKMSSYAPLLAKERHTQWNPDMIYFNNTTVKPTVGYYAQVMCGQSQGDQWLPTSIKADERTSKRQGAQERLAASTVRDSNTGVTYLKLVNILPVDVDAHVVLDGVLTGAKTCKKTVLRGPYDSTQVQPVESSVEMQPDGHITLPAYSFTLIQL